MRSDTQVVTIHASPEKVSTFLADPQNLPRWAVGFARSVRNDGGRWLVNTATGELAVRIEANRSTGVVDFFMSPAPGVEVLAASRVLPHADGSVYLFTQFQGPGMPDEVFEKSVSAVEHELTVLRALLEVECPL